jgi:hypothetical protein
MKKVVGRHAGSAPIGETIRISSNEIIAATSDT